MIDPASPRRAKRTIAFALKAPACVAVLAFIGMPAAQAQARSGPPQRPSAPPAEQAITPLDHLLQRAQSLLQGGESRAAWELLDARTGEYAGIPRFDYLLGLAALDSGQPGHAILALERVLAVDPNHLQARAEIARAYLAANELETARKQFEAVAGQKIPRDVANVIDRYLSIIDGRQQAGTGHSTFFAELGAGYDSNVNFGSSSGQWLLADGTAVTPLAVSRPQSSAAVSAILGGLRVQPIDGAWKWTIGGTLTQLTFPSVSTLNQTIVDASAGLQYRAGCHQFDMQVQLQHYRLDGDAFRNAAGLMSQWRCDLDRRTQVGLFGQAFTLSFPDQHVRDALRYTLGATAARAFDGGWTPLLLASAYVGQEDPKDTTIDQLRYSFVGVRASVTVKPGDDWRLTGAVSYEQRDFAGPEPLFGVTRLDRQTEIRLAAEKDIGKHWTVAPQLVGTRNESTLAPNDFRRVQAMIYSRYRF